MVKISPSINPKMIELIGELEKAGLITEGCIVYDEKNETAVKEIFDKYGI
ncbi:MAG: hypothetical protein IJ552_01900 [Prevotella sp.]|nr:hypothetical protein [Prevotella sp.]